MTGLVLWLPCLYWLAFFRRTPRGQMAADMAAMNGALTAMCAILGLWPVFVVGLLATTGWIVFWLRAAGSEKIPGRPRDFR